MAEFDVKNDVVPNNKVRPPSAPTISAMRSALSTFNSTTFSAARLNSMTELDMVKACRDNSLSVAGL